MVNERPKVRMEHDDCRNDSKFHVGLPVSACLFLIPKIAGRQRCLVQWTPSTAGQAELYETVTP